MKISMARIIKSMIDEPMVPKFKPPLAIGFVRRSPKVAPNGRVRMNANQNKMMREILVK